MPADPTAAIPAFLPCPACEYDLRGLPIDARCPECGEPVARAMEKPTLHHADPKWLRRVTIGLWLTAAGPMAAQGMTIVDQELFQWLRARQFKPLDSYVALTTASSTLWIIALTIGPWLIADSPLPTRFDDASGRRRLLGL